MSDTNLLIVTGIVGRDSENREFSGNVITSCPVATKESWKAKDGQWKERTTWVIVERWGKNGVDLKKGQRVLAIGKLQVDEYEDKTGNKQKKVILKADTLTVTEEPRKPEPKPEPDRGFSSSPEEDLPFDPLA